jgi:membrane fusion protein, multidrug efflux system
MSLQAELDHDEQTVLEYPELRSARAWSRPAIGNAALSADAGTEFVRARMPAPQPEPQDDDAPGARRVIDLPPVHDDQQSRQDAERENKRRSGLLQRHPFALTIGLVALLPIAAAAYLYWDYSQHFQSTDDAFVAARSFSIEPKVAGYITAVPVTDNQHVAAGDVIARIDDRDYRAALDQAKAQLVHDQALLEQAQKNLGRYQTSPRQVRSLSNKLTIKASSSSRTRPRSHSIRRTSTQRNSTCRTPQSRLTRRAAWSI